MSREERRKKIRQQLEESNIKIYNNRINQQPTQPITQRVNEIMNTQPTNITKTTGNIQNSKMQQARINQGNSNVLIPQTKTVQPVAQDDIKLKKYNAPSRLNDLAYVGKYATNELVGALENTAQGVGYDVLNYSNEKKNKNVLAAAVDTGKSFTSFGNPLSTANTLIDLSVNQAKSLKELFTGNRNTKERIVDYIGNNLTDIKSALPGFNQVMELGNLAIETEEAITGKDKQDIINRNIETTRNISKNYEQRRENLEQDISVGQPTKTVGKVFGQVSRMLPTIASNTIAPGTRFNSNGAKCNGSNSKRKTKSRR